MIRFNAYFILIFLLIGSIMWTSCGKKNPQIKTNPQEPINVYVAQVAHAGQQDILRISGKIKAQKFATVSSRIPGHIVELKVKVGDKIHNGQTLIQLDDQDYRSKIGQSDAVIREVKTNLLAIEKDYGRIKTLFDKRSATQKELDDITTQKEILEANLSRANEARNDILNSKTYTRLQAPFSGSVVEKHVNQGDLANPGRPLLTIESNDRFQVEALIPESKITHVVKGREVEVIIKSSGLHIEGEISEISTSSLHTGGQYMAKINLTYDREIHNKLFSGMYVNVNIPVSEIQNNLITIGSNAIVRQGQLTGVYYVNEDEIALLRWIRLGRNLGDQIEVLSGMSEGETYISNPDGRISNGVKIAVK